MNEAINHSEKKINERQAKIMIKKIQNELAEKYQENFSVEIKAYTIEFYSENHLYVFNSKAGTLQKMF